MAHNSRETPNLWPPSAVLKKKRAGFTTEGFSSPRSSYITRPTLKFRPEKIEERKEMVCLNDSDVFFLEHISTSVKH